MKLNLKIPGVLILGVVACILIAQEPAPSANPDRPDPRETFIPIIKTSLGTMPGVNALPAHPDLPDALTMNDGTKVTTIAQWNKRREEIKRILEYYSIGLMPPPPGNVRGTEIHSELVMNGKVKYRLVKLTFGPQSSLELYIGIFTPTDGKGPYPTIISQSSEPPGGPTLPRSPQGENQGRGQDILLPVSLMLGTTPAATTPAAAGAPAAAGRGRGGAAAAAGAAGAGAAAPAAAGAGRGAAAAGPAGAPAAAGAGRGGGRGGGATAESIAAGRSDVFARGYALVIYNDGDCAEDTTHREPDGSYTFRHTRFYPAYPGYDWGILAGWAWGASRVADFLVTDPSIDKNKLIITGASRAGKSAMVAAAFDNRLMGAPVVTGGGGIGAYRFAGADNSETLDIMQKKYPSWWGPHLHEFWGQREKLPFDEHWFLALCAPKPFIALEGNADTISLPTAVEHSIRAAWPVYQLYGKKDNLGVHYSQHAHAFTTEDWTTMMDFADKYLRGMPVSITFDHFLTPEQRAAAVAAGANGGGRGGRGGPATAPANGPQLQP